MKKVILDVDTGSDDAIAIMTAVLSPELEVLGVCSVNGNRCIDNTTENSLRVMECLGEEKRVPVYRGAALPLTVSLTKGRRDAVPFQGQKNQREDVHGDFLPLPKAHLKEEREPAVMWLLQTLLAAEPKSISIIAVGPLTNLALLLCSWPEAAERIDRLYIMGGGWREQNITPAAEFNFWIDPEAAAIVLNSGCDIVLVPLDATHAAALPIGLAEELERAGSALARLAAVLMRKRLSGYNNWQPMQDQTTVPIHDALAVCAAIDETVLKDVRNVHVAVDIGGGAADGQSICDVEQKNKEAVPNVHIALSADAEKFAQMLRKVFCDAKHAGQQTA